jgi:hypothetical protein
MDTVQSINFAKPEKKKNLLTLAQLASKPVLRYQSFLNALGSNQLNYLSNITNIWHLVLTIHTENFFL